MKPEQKMGATFLAAGVAMGFMSTQVGGAPGTLISLAVYIGALYGMKRAFREKKTKWLVSNSVMVFFLSWLVSWIFIFNTV